MAHPLTRKVLIELCVAQEKLIKQMQKNERHCCDVVRSGERDAILAAVEFGYRECEKGHNIQMALEMAELFTTKSASH